ncbi:MAG: amidohydrolase family protein [Gammaproteobacteria bacterium]
MNRPPPRLTDVQLTGARLTGARLAWALLALGMAFAPIQGMADDAPRMGEAAKDLPLFDAHMHWKEPAWEPIPPHRVISFMDRNGVAMALVSASPDDGTITLWEYAPNRIVPEMRPYDDKVGPRNWRKTEGVGDLIEQRVRKYQHQGIGEIHLHDVDPLDEPLMKRIVALALEKNIPMHVHSGHEPIDYLYELGPDLTIIWAHAGLVTPVDVVEQTMARHDSLYADTSYREIDILSYKHGIDKDWRRVLERFSDRFMIGTDTWVNSQWARYDELIAMNRAWLAHLTPDSARKIAYQNAERLFGRKISRDLLGTR